MPRSYDADDDPWSSRFALFEATPNFLLRCRIKEVHINLFCQESYYTVHNWACQMVNRSKVPNEEQLESYPDYASHVV